MAEHSIRLDEQLDAYVRLMGTRESEPARKLRELSKETLVNAQLAIRPEEAGFLKLLVQMLGVKKALEIGVYAGYSALAIAEGMVSDGTLIALERDPRFPPVGQPFWAEAGVDHMIDLRLGDALPSLENILADSAQLNSFDFAFVDADKNNYPNYYEICLTLLRPGGVMVLDNVLWYGRVVDDNDQTKQTNSIRKMNQIVHDDPRVDMSLLPIGDGMTLIRKK